MIRLKYRNVEIAVMSALNGHSQMITYWYLRILCWPYLQDIVLIELTNYFTTFNLTHELLCFTLSDIDYLGML